MHFRNSAAGCWRIICPVIREPRAASRSRAAGPQRETIISSIPQREQHRREGEQVERDIERPAWPARLLAELDLSLDGRPPLGYARRHGEVAEWSKALAC